MQTVSEEYNFDTCLFAAQKLQNCMLFFANDWQRSHPRAQNVKQHPGIAGVNGHLPFSLEFEGKI